MDEFDKFKKDFQNLSKDEQIKIFNDFCGKNGLKMRRFIQWKSLMKSSQA